jgi:hypothetical protein
MMENKKRKRADTIMFYKCELCNHVTTSKTSLAIHTRSVKHLMNNYDKHENHENDMYDYIGLLMNEKLDDFIVNDEMMKSIGGGDFDFNIKKFI